MCKTSDWSSFPTIIGKKNSIREASLFLTRFISFGDDVTLPVLPQKMTPGSHFRVMQAFGVDFYIEARGPYEFVEHPHCSAKIKRWDFQECEPKCELPHEICSNPHNKMTLDRYQCEKANNMDCYVVWPKEDFSNFAKRKKHTRTKPKRLRRICKLSNLFKDDDFVIALYKK